MTEKGYQPSAESRRILDRAWEYLQSVPYQVSARWLFYRLVQDGTYPDKATYNSRFLPLLSRARKAFYKGWRPDTLADETRAPIYRGHGYRDAIDWLRGEICSLGCTLDQWAPQPCYIAILFEAQAMSAQFEHYTENITLFPFKGDTSIPYKWGIAKHLEWVHQLYPEKPIRLLYFGDLDKKGLQIPESAIKDVRTWCSAPFEDTRCGLNPGDERRFNLPENPEKPGTYQWEALSDKHAQTLITEWVSKFVDADAFSQTQAQEKAITARFQKTLQHLIISWQDEDLREANYAHRNRNYTTQEAQEGGDSNAEGSYLSKRQP